jgi:hypothetical protein
LHERLVARPPILAACGRNHGRPDLPCTERVGPPVSASRHISLHFETRGPVAPLLSHPRRCHRGGFFDGAPPTTGQSPHFPPPGPPGWSRDPARFLGGARPTTGQSPTFTHGGFPNWTNRTRLAGFWRDGSGLPREPRFLSLTLTNPRGKRRDREEGGQGSPAAPLKTGVRERSGLAEWIKVAPTGPEVTEEDP